MSDPADREEAKDGPPVAELTPGRAFRGRYVCARKDRLTARNGSGYLSLELRDRSGSIPARIFRDIDQIALRFERGDVIEARGKVERFRGVLSAELEDVRKVDPSESDGSEFLPTAYRDRDELEGFLEHLTREIHNAGLRSVVERLIFEGPAAEEFRRAPCTRAGHHAYVGGLIEHTVAVGTLVTETCVLHPKLNSDLLMTAALIHDIGKTEEFTYGAEIGLSERGRALGHLHLGAEMIGDASASLERGERDALMAVVMCHHGTDALRLRHFPSAEAIALYRLNALDAQVKTALEHGIT
ncbi:MAG TPA: OB-fold nucleic acid binding domain-containing protein [Solirubrobacterales bacterium]|nr:OB-fold nucleic acid binding domain-containing protein [Solirubrobacterales bacterium]